MPRTLTRKANTPEYIDPRPVWEHRAGKGLSTPMMDEKLLVFEKMSIPQAGILAQNGGYKPFRIVDRAHAHPAMTKIITGGVRGSKSISTAAEVTVWSPHSDLIWLAADTYDLARQEFEYAVEALLSLGWTKRHFVTLPRSKYLPCVLETIWGTLIETRSLKDVTNFVARAPDMIALCEPGLASPDSILKARERLSTRSGQLWAAGTFEEAKYNWLEEYWRKGIRWPNPESVKSFSVPTWLNRVSFPLGKQDPGIQLLKNSCRTLDEFLLRCGGVPIKQRSSVIGDAFDEKRHVVPIPFVRRNEKGLVVPVRLAIDPGFGGGSFYVVLAIQESPCKNCRSTVINVVDEIAVDNMVYQKVIELARVRDWWPNTHTGVVDPWAGVSHPFGNVSVQSLWWSEAGINLTVPDRIAVEELVGIVKDALIDPVMHHPHVFIDPRCSRLIWELKSWKRKRGTEGYGKPSEKNCDAVKALGYYVTDWRTRRFGADQDFLDGPRVYDIRYG